jgi:hypothetical protein
MGKLICRLWKALPGVGQDYLHVPGLSIAPRCAKILSF